MDIVAFEDKAWNEIPEQDNPAFDINEGHGRHSECIMVTRALPLEAKCVGPSGYVVIHVPIKGDVIRRGLFWNFSDAMKFATAIWDDTQD